MKRLFCLGLPLVVASAFAADATVDVQSAPHPLVASAAIQPNLMPGVAGVGSQVPGGSMPCIGCYGAPAGGKVILTSTDTQSLPANSTNLIGWFTVLPDGDGDKGLAKVVYTTTLDGLTVQNTTHIWVARPNSGG
jgi:hypothetical protein